MTHIYYTLLSLITTGLILIIHYYIFSKQIMYFNTLIHIYKQIYMFLKAPSVTERSATGDTLVSSPPFRSPSLTSTPTMTYISYLP
jgi:hypothetical protein